MITDRSGNTDISNKSGTDSKEASEIHSDRNGDTDMSENSGTGNNEASKMHTDRSGDTDISDTSSVGNKDASEIHTDISGDTDMSDNSDIDNDEALEIITVRPEIVTDTFGIECRKRDEAWDEGKRKLIKNAEDIAFANHKKGELIYE